MDFSPESDQGAFNAGIEYLKTLVAIEREIDLAFLSYDFKELDRLLDVLWIELSEWMNDKEIEEHATYRSNQKQAYSRIRESMIRKIGTVESVMVEYFIYRYQALKKLIHKKGLRMPKKDDPAFAMSGKQY